MCEHKNIIVLHYVNEEAEMFIGCKVRCIDCDEILFKTKGKEKELAYLDRITPEGEKVNGDKANYKIDSVREQNKKIAIYFEKLPNK